MKRFIENPREVQAIQVTRENVPKIAGLPTHYVKLSEEHGQIFVMILNLSGSCIAEEGDWIVWERGDYWRVKEQTFKALYTPVKDQL